MNEKDLNRDFGKLFRNKNYFAYKLSDDANSFTTTNKKPFDIIISTDKYDIYAEGKLIKDGFSSFNFSKLEDHQIINLSLISSLSKNRKLFTKCIVYVGIYEVRKLYKLMILDIDLINYLISINKTSILKKEQILLNTKNCLFDMKKDDIENIENFILTIGKWKNIFKEEFDETKN